MKWLSKRVSTRFIAALCVVALALGALPLLFIAPYSHPTHDDFLFATQTHAAWKASGSLPDVVAAAVKTTAEERNNWEGTYTTTFLATLQPGLFGESRYGITTYVLLGGLLLSLWVFMASFLRGALGLPRTVAVAAFGMAGFLAVQFVPCASEAFFWWNGGTAYTLMWSLLLLDAAVWLRLSRAKGARFWALFALALLLSALLGGAKYATALFAVVVGALWTAKEFLLRQPRKWYFLALTAALVAGFLFSAFAPGNRVRMEMGEGAMNPVLAIAQALFFGVSLMGDYTTLPLAAALLVLALLAYPALRESALRFAHPVWFSLCCALAFCAQLTPTLFTYYYLGSGRSLNTYWYTWVVMTFALTLYWTGYIARRKPAPAEPAPRGVRLTAVAVAAALLFVGCCAYRTEGAQVYGPQNMAGGSALRSLANGQAQTYAREMALRDALMNDPAQADVTIRKIENVPPVFMTDVMGESIETVVTRMYRRYYQKESVEIDRKR